MAGRFRFLGACHSHKGVIHKKGSIIDSDEDLDKTFPGMFVKELDFVPRPEVAKAAPAIDKKSERAKVAQDDEVETEENGDEEVEDARANVTDQFVLAEEKGVTVFQDEKGKFVVEKDGEVLKTLDTKTAAKTFLKSME